MLVTYAGSVGSVDTYNFSFYDTSAFAQARAFGALSQGALTESVAGVLPNVLSAIASGVYQNTLTVNLVLDMSYMDFERRLELHKEAFIYAVEHSLGGPYVVTLSTEPGVQTDGKGNTRITMALASPIRSVDETLAAYDALFCPLNVTTTSTDGSGHSAPPACPGFVAQLQAAGLTVGGAYKYVLSLPTKYTGLQELIYNSMTTV